MTIIRETYITPKFRVRMTEHPESEFGRYWIEVQQDARDILGLPWEKHEDGWRNCLSASVFTEAKAFDEFDEEVRRQEWRKTA